MLLVILDIFLIIQFDQSRNYIYFIFLPMTFHNPIKSVFLIRNIVSIEMYTANIECNVFHIETLENQFPIRFVSAFM